MFLIIAGSRNFHHAPTLELAMQEFQLHPEVILHGAARGVDTLAQKYAEAHCISVVAFPAQWDRYGKSAGPIRNNLMAARGDALLALWDGSSPGTRHMILAAAQRGLPIFIKLFDSF
jgi:hypothetical protein